MNKDLTFGSVCSGIEASHFAFSPLGFRQIWSSEIADFPSKLLKHHFPSIPNVGDMRKISSAILNRKIEAPDLFCGGTPCQAFSLAGWQNGLEDERAQLTMTFIEIANAIDKIRIEDGKDSSIVLWENVEGVLNEKTNAFGNFVAGLAGFDEEIKINKWPKSGYLKGRTRNVAWRVLDAKYFGLPQQRKRLYVIAGGKNFNPDQALFEIGEKDVVKELKVKYKRKVSNSPTLFNESNSERENIFYKEGIKFEMFREYTDCLYAAYGTKWNGNAAAYNGSLYIAENDRIRRLTPLECERLMGFPDNYTEVSGNSHTNRFQAIGNSWAVPVVKWIGKRIKSILYAKKEINNIEWQRKIKSIETIQGASLYLLNSIDQFGSSEYLNSSNIPNDPTYGEMIDIVEPNHALGKFYLSAKACSGILRRKTQRNLKMNSNLETLMIKMSREEENLKSRKKISI